MACSACGATISEGVRFCTSCGAPQEAAVPPPPPPPPSAASSAPSASAPPPPAAPAPPLPPPPAAAPTIPTSVDPHAFGPAAARLANSARKSARVALAIASSLLDEGELVECVVTGHVLEHDGVAVLTNRRVLVVNDREWKPEVLSFRIDSSLTVRGEAAGSEATLTVQREAQLAVIARIADVPLAQDMAQRLRGRAAAG